MGETKKRKVGSGLVVTHNIKMLITELNALSEYRDDEERMAILSSPAGMGKSKSLLYVANKLEYILLEAAAWWTPTSIARSLAKELNLALGRGTAENMENVVLELSARGTPIIIDEALYLKGKGNALINLFRSLYDKARIPILFAGEEMSWLSELSYTWDRRITREFALTPLSMEEALQIVKMKTTIPVCEKYVKALLKASKGYVGRFVDQGLSKAIREAELKKWDAIDLKTWGDRPLVTTRRSRRHA